jgi:amino acid transporter
MAACLETLFNITYVSEITRTAAMIPIHCQVLPLSAAPWLVFLFYLFNYLLCLVGGRPFWTLAFIIGATSFALMMIYMFGTLAAINTPAVDYNHFCVSTAKFSFLSVLSHRAAAGNQFRGIHYLPLNSDYLKDPKKQMPRLILATVIIIFLNANFLGIAVCSQAPGIAQLPQVTYPLRNGWARIFNTDLNVGRWLHLPGLLISCLGFIYSAGKQLSSIAESGFLPKAFTHTIPIIDTPYFCLTLSTCFSFMLSMIMVKYPDIIDDMSTIPSLSMQFICVNAFVCYIIFRTKFSNLTKSFESPIGIWGAVYGIFNNVIGVISNIFFVGRNYTGITVIIILCVISTLIYVFYVSKNQKFSEEEKKVLFKAYLINGKKHQNLLFDFLFILSLLFCSKSSKPKENAKE